jgi:hypothetical protein
LAFESTALTKRTPALVFHPPRQPEKAGNVPPVSLLYLAARRETDLTPRRKGAKANRLKFKILSLRLCLSAPLR